MPSDGKLEATLHGKVSFPVASRLMAVAEASGLSESAMVRLVLTRIDEILKQSWRPQMNIVFLLNQLTVKEEQLNLFFVPQDGSEHSEH